MSTNNSDDGSPEAKKKAKRDANNDMLSDVRQQDALLWSRTEALIAVQGGVLAGTYTIRKDLPMAICLMGFGMAITLILFFVVQRDQLYRNKYMRVSLVKRTRVKRRWYAPIRGCEAIWLVYLLLFAADVTLLLYVILNRHAISAG